MGLGCRLITNICKLFGDSFGTMGRTMGRTFDNFYLPPREIATLSVESGGGVRWGVRGDLSLTDFHPHLPPPLTVFDVGGV